MEQKEEPQSDSSGGGSDGGSCKILISAMVGQEFQPPEKMEVGGHTIILEDRGYAIGMDEHENVYFKFEKSGEIVKGAVSAKSLEMLRSDRRSCDHLGCRNFSVGSHSGSRSTCWVHLATPHDPSISALSVLASTQ